MKGMAYNGWRVGLPDKFWPVTLDNFFDNPDEIRELGLRLLKLDSARESSDDAGGWPGYRSEHIFNSDPGLAKRIVEKILSCYFNLDFERVFWNQLDLQFQLITSIDKDKNSIKNKGWIHRDVVEPRLEHDPEMAPQEQLAGLIYLTPDIERDTGTSLFDMKKDETLEDWEKTINLRREIRTGHSIGDEEIENAWKTHRLPFIEKVRFENIYNRIIMYDTREFHAANSYYTSKNNRLTLVFFIGGILARKWPLERVRDIAHTRLTPGDPIENKEGIIKI